MTNSTTHDRAPVFARAANITALLLLAATVAGYVVYLAKVIPVLAPVAAGFDRALPLIVRIQIIVSHVTLQLLPVLAVAGLAVYLGVRSGRIRLPAFVRSGHALLLTAAVVLLISFMGALAALWQAAEFLGWYLPRR